MGNKQGKKKTSFDSRNGRFMSNKRSPAMHTVVDSEDMDTLQRMLNKGCDVNKRDSTGMTPLHCAALNGNENCVRMLLDHGATIKTAQLFFHPIHFAAQGGFVNIVRLLLDNGDGINATDSMGNSPLSLAVEFDHLETVELLLKRGASVDPKLFKLAVECGSVGSLKELLMFKPSLLQLEDLNSYRFTHKSWPCLKLLILLGVQFNAETFRQDHRPLGMHEFIVDYKIMHPPPYYCFQKDKDSFELFMESLEGDQIAPGSLLKLAQLSFYRACRDQPVKRVIETLQCPKQIERFLLMDT